MILAMLDTETDGLNFAVDHIVEIGIILMDYHPDADQTWENHTWEGVRDGEYTAFQDPGQPIPPEVTAKNHITDDMVRGQSIDWNRVRSMLGQADYAVAFNAAFDRGFIEEEIGILPEKTKWACAMAHIPWKTMHGMSCQSLRHIAMEHGITPKTSHRALDDVYTMAAVLAVSPRANLAQPSEDRAPYVDQMLRNARRSVSLLECTVGAYDEACNAVLKSHGFRWSGPPKKVWWTTAYTDEVAPFIGGIVFPSGSRARPRIESNDLDIDTLSPHFKEVHQYQ